MIANEEELQVTRNRIARFLDQLACLRKTETNATNYRAAASGYIGEIERMQLEIREFLSAPPTELTKTG